VDIERRWDFGGRFERAEEQDVFPRLVRWQHWVVDIGDSYPRDEASNFVMDDIHRSQRLGISGMGRDVMRRREHGNYHKGVRWRKDRDLRSRQRREGGKMVSASVDS